MKRIALLLVCLLAAPAWSQTLKLPPEKKTPANIPVIVGPTENTGGAIKWMLPDPGVEEILLTELFPPAIADQATGRIFFARQPGRYRIWAVCGKGDKVSEKAECVLIVGDVPDPVPVPPGPTPQPDTLKAAVQSAYTADTTPGKAVYALQLAAVYKVALANYLADPSLKTLSDLQSALQTSAKNIPLAALPNVRQVIANEAVRVLGTDPAAPLDQAARDKAKALFQRFVAALEALK